MTESRYRSFTDKERELALALGRCSLPLATAAKRFCLDIAAQAAKPGAGITDKQAEYMTQMAWKFRRQLHPKIRPSVQPRPMGAKPIARTG